MDKFSGLPQYKIKYEEGSVSNKILNYFLFFPSQKFIFLQNPF